MRELIYPIVVLIIAAIFIVYAVYTIKESIQYCKKNPFDYEKALRVNRKNRNTNK